MALSSPKKTIPEPKTPTRRSKRGQPVVTAYAGGSSTGVAWTTRNPPRTRPIDPTLDLEGDDAEAWNELDEEEQGKLETRVYDSFSRNKTTAMKKKAPGRKRATTETTTVTDTFCVGDTVLVSTSSREPSIAVIAGLWETDLGAERPLAERMCIRLRWFLRPSQMPKIRAQREHLHNEIYYSLKSPGVVSPQAILHPCRVYDGDGDELDLFGANPTDDGYVCRFAVDSQRGLFYEFSWDEHRTRALAKLQDKPPPEDPWAVAVKQPEQVKRPKKASKKVVEASTPESRISKASASRRRISPVPEERESSEEEPSDDDFEQPSDVEEEEDEEAADAVSSDESEVVSEDDGEYGRSTTRSKKRKRGTVPSTPRKRKKTMAHPTPHSKAVLARRAQSSPRKRQKFTRVAQPGYSAETLSNLPEDPYLRAMQILHVASRPDSLPCREDEFTHVLDNILALLEEGSGGCLYISGLPGTGKTATVHAVIRELMKLAESNEVNPFTYVEINGLRIPDPPTAYTVLWESLSKHDVKKYGHLSISSKESLRNLTNYFGKSQARGPEAHACIVLMDELDQLVTTKQDVVYNFFNWPTIADSKLIVIAVANTHDLPERVMTGRVRSRLGMVRTNFAPYTSPQLRTIVESRMKSVQRPGDKVVINSLAIELAAKRVANITGDARRILDVCRRAVELVRATEEVAKPQHIITVMAVMQNNPTAAYLRDLGFHERVMLVSLVKCIKREGVEEIKWGEVQHQHLTYMDHLRGKDDPKRKLTNHELAMVLESLVSSRAMLLEDGAAAARKDEEDRKVMLNLEQNEVERVLGEEGGDAWKRILN